MGDVRENYYAAKAIESYRDLHVWQAAIELTVACYEETKKFPPSETYGLTSQIRRSSTSVAANIAEGYGRENTGSYVQFLRIAQGSLKELETRVIIAKRIGYLESSQEEFLLQKSEQIGRMLRALMRGVQRTI